MQNGSYDPTLGGKIQALLLDKKLENPVTGYTISGSAAYTRIFDGFTMIAHALNLDLEDSSLKDTPKRVAKMFCEEIFTGLNYDTFPRCMAFPNTMGADEMVAVTDIAVRSMCEHHFMPFVGTATVAYIPGPKILGTSKFNRVVDFFSRRPQVQERLVEQVVATLIHILETEDVAVVIKADHMCTRFRGVQDFHSSMVTSKLSGRFRTVDALRNEFLTLTR